MYKGAQATPPGPIIFVVKPWTADVVIVIVEPSVENPETMVGTKVSVMTWDADLDVITVSLDGSGTLDPTYDCGGAIATDARSDGASMLDDPVGWVKSVQATPKGPTVMVIGLLRAS